MPEVAPSCCAICGCPFKKQDTAILLSDPARELEQIQDHFATKWGPSKFATDLDIDETAATYAGRSTFIATTDGQEFKACCNGSALPGAHSYQIPAHCYCLKLAKYVFRSGCSRLSSMRQLFKVLRMRCLATDANGRSLPLSTIDAPDNYQLPPEIAGKNREPLRSANKWDGADDHWCTADAWDIADFTTGILAELKPARPPFEQSKAGFTARLEELPQELQDQILSYLFTERDFPRQCTYLAPQTVWMDMLLDGHIIPFLWDLDRGALERKVVDGQKRGIEWDFELLVRRLCQPGSGESDPCVIGMPAGLRNRRRIWRLLTQMYVGDYLPEASWNGSSMGIPRYWDAVGEPQYPLVWMRRDKAGK